MLPERCSFALTGCVIFRLVACAAGVLLTAAPFARADWPVDGVVLCSLPQARNALIAPDGVGGAFVAWTDERNSSTGTNPDIYMQRVTASGTIAFGWPVDGLAVGLASRSQLTEGIHSISPDGLGGVIIAWRDSRNSVPGGTSVDIYAQRILADGTIAPGWPVNGAAVARTPEHQLTPVVVADGYGGAFITWEELAADPNIHLQHLGPAGNPMPGWPDNGLPICTAPGFQGQPQLAPDGSGGILIAWGDLSGGLVASSAQRLDGSGQLAPGWPVNGKLIAPTFYVGELVSDGMGGAFLAGRTLGALVDDDYYLQRFTGSGEIVTGWPAGGVDVCVAPDERQGLRMEPDGSGGVLLAWSDYRDGSDSDVYALRIRPDGTRFPGWPANGLAVTANTLADDDMDMVPDGQGGVYLCWVHSMSAPRIRLQYLTGAGTVAPGWPAEGREIPSQVGSPRPHMVADGAGGAIVVWTDYESRVRALRIGADGPVAVEVSLVSAEAESDRVRLAWYAPDVGVLAATVQRRTTTGDWESLGQVRSDGNGRLEYEDRSVIAGVRYGYRLAYRDGEVLSFTTESWVEVPALRFALRGLTPNPARGGNLMVGFSLPGGEPATLAVFDLAGRRVLEREVGSLGAGTHAMSLTSAGRLPPGVYTIRLTQGAEQARVRGVVLR